MTYFVNYVGKKKKKMRHVRRGLSIIKPFCFRMAVVRCLDKIACVIICNIGRIATVPYMGRLQFKTIFFFYFLKKTRHNVTSHSRSALLRRVHIGCSDHTSYTETRVRTYIITLYTVYTCGV